jgi:hypothetical protein
MNRPLFTIVGFFLFSLGVLSLILSLVGLKFTFLDAIYNQGVLTVLIQLFLLFGGMIILYLSRVGKGTAAEEGSES